MTLNCTSLNDILIKIHESGRYNRWEQLFG
jgi:hypothetical protein